MKINKECVVCGGTKSIAYIYGVQSCSGCASFFRRTVLENDGKIPEPCTVENCRGCTSCQMKKCKDKGMDERRIRVGTKKGSTRRINGKPEEDKRNRRSIDRVCKKGSSSSIKNIKIKEIITLPRNTIKIGNAKTVNNSNIPVDLRQDNIERHIDIDTYIMNLPEEMADKEAEKLRSELSRDKLLVEETEIKNLSAELQELKEKLKDFVKQKDHDASCLKLKLEKAKQKFNQLIKDRDEYVAECEKISEELQIQENLGKCLIIDLQIKLDEANKSINKINADKDKYSIEISKLKNELQKEKAHIEKISSETAAQQVEFDPSWQPIVKPSSSQDGTNKNSRKYALRKNLYL